VRIDFGIRIEIDLEPLHLDPASGHCRWHCAIGRIRYDDVDRIATPGTLVYVKSCLTGDEPADVLQFARAHPPFPHESTGNQFYTESQFESYRALGQHTAERIFELSLADMNEGSHVLGDDDPRRLLFASLERRWFAMPPLYEESFVETTHGYMDVQKS